jgi:hypothetical protein
MGFEQLQRLSPYSSHLLGTMGQIRGCGLFGGGNWLEKLWTQPKPI